MSPLYHLQWKHHRERTDRQSFHGEALAVSFPDLENACWMSGVGERWESAVPRDIPSRWEWHSQEWLVAPVGICSDVISCTWRPWSCDMIRKTNITVISKSIFKCLMHCLQSFEIKLSPRGHRFILLPLLSLCNRASSWEVAQPPHCVDLYDI